jgi:NTE family protein
MRAKSFRATPIRRRAAPAGWRPDARWCHAALLIAMAAGLYGCATFPGNPPLRHWDPQGAAPAAATGRRGDMLILLAFSGGGTRAAAFAYGVLEELRDTEVVIGGRPRRLLDEIDVVSGVSGGSFTAAYYGLNGDGIFRDFEERFLRRNVQRDLALKLLNPFNWVRLLSPWFGRSDIAAEYYDEQIFDGASFGDLSRGPRIELVINSTDLVRGSRFSFRQNELDYLCADLAGIPLARAVAASSAVPGFLTPVVLRSYTGTCGFEPPAWIETALENREDSRRRLRQAQILQSYLDPAQDYVYLLDGGIADNLGVRFSFEGTVRDGDLQQSLERVGVSGARQILMIVVNAETEPELTPREGGLISTGLLTLIRAVTGIQTRSTNFETLELMRSSFTAWARELSEKRGEPVEFRLIDLYFDALSDPAERAYLRSLPTSFVLDDEAVDRLRAAGRKLLRTSPSLREALERMAELPQQ